MISSTVRATTTLWLRLNLCLTSALTCVLSPRERILSSMHAAIWQAVRPVPPPVFPKTRRTALPLRGEQRQRLWRVREVVKQTFGQVQTMRVSRSAEGLAGLAGRRCCAASPSPWLTSRSALPGEVFTPEIFFAMPEGRKPARRRQCAGRPARLRAPRSARPIGPKANRKPV
jgi:hypothetical protein